MSVYNGVITDSKSYKKTLECILNGVTDPEVLLEQIHRRTLNRCLLYTSSSGNLVIPSDSFHIPVQI